MKKKIIGVVSALVLVVILATCLVACNPYKWNGIGGGDPKADVESNGGYVVKQGDYLYYINGYDGTGGSGNEWGTPVKQSIVRSEIKDGVVDLTTTKVVVPKIIYNTSVKGGFAIFGEWIYYATPNNDRDKNGTASTTDTDFMRTKIDASVTQRLGKINVRNAEYLFTENRVIYYTSNKISYIDFSGMKTDKNIDNAKGAREGVLAEDVSSVAWSMGCDTIYYTKTITDENSYKNYNELCSIKIDGSNQTTIATEDTFVKAAEGEEKNPELDPQNVFKYTLRDMYVEEDNTVTLYYVKTHNLESSDKTDGLFMAKADSTQKFVETERMLVENGASTIYPLGYEEGAIVNVSSAIWWHSNDGTKLNRVQVLKEAKNICKIDKEAGELYFTATSSATALEKISYKNAGNATIIIEEGIKVDWLNLDFVGDDFYFFATDDSNLMHTINIKTFNRFDKDDEDEYVKSTYIGFEKEEDEDEDKE